jgi:hypothetical protein
MNDRDLERRLYAMTETIRTIAAAAGRAVHRLSCVAVFEEDRKALVQLDWEVVAAMDGLDHWDDPDFASDFDRQIEDEGVES